MCKGFSTCCINACVDEVPDVITAPVNKRQWFSVKKDFELKWISISSHELHSVILRFEELVSNLETFSATLLNGLTRKIRGIGRVFSVSLAQGL